MIILMAKSLVHSSYLSSDVRQADCDTQCHLMQSTSYFTSKMATLRCAEDIAGRPTALVIDDDATDLQEKGNRRISETGSVIVHSNASDSPLVGCAAQRSRLSMPLHVRLSSFQWCTEDPAVANKSYLALTYTFCEQ